jgi:uncharacterized protein
VSSNSQIDSNLVYARALALPDAVEKKSVFLLGPRQTGKTSLIRSALPKAPRFDLLQSEVFLDLSQNPRRLREELRQPGQLAVIHEIQKLPSLLDEVQWLIEERKLRFVLTGSSARKLRRSGTNLLGGRARSLYLHPLIAREVPDFDLLRALDRGLIPSIYLSDDPKADLRAYAGDYLKTEILAEGAARSIPSFARFLEVAALCSGQLLNFTKIASDAQVKRTTVHEYFEILKDTLIAWEVPAFRGSTRRKPVAASKLYFFDVGVARHLQRAGPLHPGSSEFGFAFECYLHHELRAFVSYRSPGAEISHWRSTSGFEVDFLVGDSTAIEVKAAKRVTDADLKGLRALGEEVRLKRRWVVSQEERGRVTEDGIEILPWREALERVWEEGL